MSKLPDGGRAVTILKEGGEIHVIDFGWHSWPCPSFPTKISGRGQRTGRVDSQVGQVSISTRPETHRISLQSSAHRHVQALSESTAPRWREILWTASAKRSRTAPRLAWCDAHHAGERKQRDE